jgi:thiol-disulfide isomerase/thioredoxin
MKKIIVSGFTFLAAVISFGQEIKSMKIADLEKIIAESNRPMIVNMWATWCKPCIEELPYFIEETKKHQKDSIQLLLVSLDFKEEFPFGISTFAMKRNITAPIFWLDETNADYFCPRIDKNWSGAIPATLFVNNKTGYKKFIESQLSHDKLKKQISALLETP